jgi:hypothetical protein
MKFNSANFVDLEEVEIDELYHDASEEELRKMGCFDNLSEEDDYYESKSL